MERPISRSRTPRRSTGVRHEGRGMSVLPQVGGRNVVAELSRFRTAFYGCLSARADAFFEPTDGAPRSTAVPDGGVKYRPSFCRRSGGTKLEGVHPAEHRLRQLCDLHRAVPSHSGVYAGQSLCRVRVLPNGSAQGTTSHQPFATPANRVTLGPLQGLITRVFRGRYPCSRLRTRTSTSDETGEPARMAEAVHCVPNHHPLRHGTVCTRQTSTATDGVPRRGVEDQRPGSARASARGAPPRVSGAP